MKRDTELGFMYDFDLIEDTSNRVYMKRLAIQTCVNMIAKTISQSEFRVRKDGKTIKDELYYRFNVKPNMNMTASTFWETVIYKLIYDNECLIIKTDKDDLVIADDYTRVEYGLLEDHFKNVVVKEFEFKRSFKMSEVIYLEFNNEKLMPLIDGLFGDYGDLFGRLIESQKRRNQIRATVDIESISAKDEKATDKIQGFIDRVYKTLTDKSVAVIPQQKGFTYQEHSGGQQSSQSVDEINKVTDGFIDQIATALGIPVSLLHGDMADVEKQTRNYMTFCIDPLLKKIGDELNAKFVTKQDYYTGKRVDIKRISYNNIFDHAGSVDKLRSSGVANGHELRDLLGLPYVDDPMLEKFVITKNYSEDLEGGDNDQGNTDQEQE